MNDMRILQWILTLEQGGAQQMLLDTCIEWQKSGHTVVVCSFEDGIMRKKLEDAHILVVLLLGKRATIANLPVFFRDIHRIHAEIATIIAKHNITVLQTHLLSVYDFLTPMLLKNCPSLETVVWTFHNTQLEFEASDTSPLKKWVYYRLYRYWANQVSFVIAVSDSVARFLTTELGIAPETVKIFPTAIPITQYAIQPKQEVNITDLDISQHHPILLTIGRLADQKGHQYLLDALPAVIENKPDTLLLIVGEGDLLDTLKAQAKQLGVAGHVCFLGHREDIPIVFAIGDIYIQPSLYEGLPRVILEAMASETAIVASDIAGIHDVLQDNKHALLVPPGDASALANAILRLLNHPTLAEQLVSSARESLDIQYDIAHLAKRYIDAFRSHAKAT